MLAPLQRTFQSRKPWPCLDEEAAPSCVYSSGTCWKCEHFLVRCPWPRATPPQGVGTHVHTHDVVTLTTLLAAVFCLS